MNTRPDKSMLYFLDNLHFCIREMLGLYGPEKLVLKATPEAVTRITAWLNTGILTLDKDFHLKLYGVEIEIADEVDSNLGFSVQLRDVEENT